MNLRLISIFVLSLSLGLNASVMAADNNAGSTNTTANNEAAGMSMFNGNEFHNYNTGNVPVQIGGGGAVVSALDMSRAVPTIQWQPSWKAQGCSQEAWDQLTLAQAQALKDYQDKNSRINRQIMTAASITPSTLGLNGCLSSVNDMMGKYNNIASDLKNAIQNGVDTGVVGNFIKGMFKQAGEKLWSKAQTAACSWANQQVKNLEQSIMDKTGVSGIISKTQGVLANPFGTISSKVDKAFNDRIDKALQKTIDKK